jgi:glycosyltransferase involved in cell wall biosynthesis
VNVGRDPLIMPQNESREAASPTDPMKPKILMIGAAVNEEVMDILKVVDKVPQIQTYRFHWAVINGIEAAGGAQIDILSTVPTRDYPFTRKLLWGLRRVRREKAEGGQFIIMPFVNLLGLKQITRFLSCFWFTLCWLLKHREQPGKVMLLYGLIVSHLYVALVLGKLFGAKVAAIVTDPPMKKISDESWIYSLARAADRYLLLRGLRCLDGFVALAEPLARLLVPGVPAIVVEGMISNEVTQFLPEVRRIEPGSNNGGEFVIMYAGQMYEGAYGIEILLDAFKLIKDPNMALWFFGRGSMVEQVQQAAQHDQRITYWGLQPDNIFYSRMRQASVMAIPRPADEWYSLFTFPSKLLEYLAMGKITISAKLAGIPSEYYPHLVLVDEMNAANLAERLREVSGWSIEKRRQMESHAQAFVWGSKTQLHQGKRICDFLSAIASNLQRKESGARS